MDFWTGFCKVNPTALELARPSVTYDAEHGHVHLLWQNSECSIDLTLDLTLCLNVRSIPVAYRLESPTSPLLLLQEEGHDDMMNRAFLQRLMPLLTTHFRP